MFEVVIPDGDFFDERTFEFIHRQGGKFTIEHSLLSISKWESKWMKPFLGSSPHEKHNFTGEEWIDYIRMMTITKNVDPKLYDSLTPKNMHDINIYINHPMTATTFSNKNPGGVWSVTTSEIIYWQMIQLGIPFECQKWHINRLMTLIRVCAEKGSKPEKVPYSEMIRDRRALNAQRLAATGSRG